MLLLLFCLHLCYQPDPKYLGIISYEDAIFMAATLLALPQHLQYGHRWVYYYCKQYCTRFLQLPLSPLPFRPPSPPKPPVVIALVLALLPCLPQALLTDEELRPRARKRLICSHEADRWQHRI